MKKLIIPVCSAVVFTAMACCCGGGGSHVNTTFPSTVATTVPTTERETFVRETIKEDPDATKYYVTFKIHVNESKEFFNEESFIGGIANEALKEDAVFFLDGNQMKSIANGHDYETTLEISEGTHIIRFERTEFSSDNYVSAPKENMGYVEDRFTIQGESVVTCSVDIGLTRMSLDDLLVKEPSETELQTESEPESESATQNEVTESSSESVSPTEEAKQEASRDDNDIDPAFKAFWDGYEQFMDRYVAFMKDYMQGKGAAAVLDYVQIMSEYAQWVEDCEEYSNADQSQFTAAELKYEAEVIARVELKLLDAAL